MKLYCLHCNYGSEYTSAKPNFCQKCGKPFINVASTPIPTNAKKLVNYPPIKDTHPIIENDDDSPVSIPQIGKLEYSIDGNFINRERLQINANKKTKNLSMAKLKKQPKGAKTPNPSKTEIQTQWTDTFPKNSRQNSASLGE